MSKQTSIVLICILLGVGVFSFAKSIDLFWDRDTLNKQIEDSLKPKIVRLEGDNARINQELGKVKNTLGQTNKSLQMVEEENSVIKEELISGRRELRQTKEMLQDKEEGLAKAVNKQNEISSENKLLKEKFNAMYVEFLEMKKTLSSIEGLRQTLRDLRSSSKKNGKTASLAKGDRSGRSSSRDTGSKDGRDTKAYGNSGYLIKNGQSTYVPKVRIKVLTVDE